MTIVHHLDEATLVRYAAGDLEEGFLVLVAAHIAMCDTCRKRAHLAEGFGGGLLEAEAGAALSPGSFDRLMQRIETPGVADRIEIERPADGDVPLPLRAYVGDRIDGVSWRSIAPGVRKRGLKLASDAGSSLFLLNIGEGMAMPEHGHGGAEMTLILSGAYRDDFGRFGPGDVADLDEHVEHQPTVEPGGPCICLVATEAPTRFKSLIGRLFQPLTGI